MFKFHCRRLLQKNHFGTNVVSISPSPQPSHREDRNQLLLFSTYDSSMILTVLLLLATVLFVSLFSLYVRRFSAAREAIHISRHHYRGRGRARRRRSSPQSNGLHISIVQSLPIFSYDGNVKEAVDCAVCLSEFQDQETIKVIPNCRHFFHQQCIDTWFLSHVSCPLCRSIQLFHPPNKNVEAVEEKLDHQISTDSPETSQASTGERKTDTPIEENIAVSGMADQLDNS